MRRTRGKRNQRADAEPDRLHLGNRTNHRKNPPEIFRFVFSDDTKSSKVLCTSEKMQYQ
ncbi:hypothetical protein [Azospirillum endophyticum]